MGNSKYLGSLSLEDNNRLSRKLWEIQNHSCFICEEEIDLELSKTNIEHIKPLVNGGKEGEDTFAITHESINKLVLVPENF